MIQEISPHTLNNDYYNGAPEEGDYVMFIEKAQIFTDPEANDLYRYGKVCKYLKPEELLYGFEVDGAKVFLGLAIPDAVKQNAKQVYVRDFGAERPELQLAGATGMHLLSWNRTHRFCGCCGGKNKPFAGERAFVCEDCGHLTFPVICPAIIVGIVDGDRILLATHSHRKKPLYSLLAGYTEIGETLEETCQREAFEEVGVRIKNVRYYGNQPWGFSFSQMIGFFAELDGSPDIHIDETEIKEAHWFTREEMPVTENPIDLTHYMMEQWRKGLI